MYASGLDADVKQFTSLHAAQRHMVDTNQCKMAYDGVEEEYDDFYDYSAAISPETGNIFTSNAYPFYKISKTSLSYVPTLKLGSNGFDSYDSESLVKIASAKM